jgi:aconitate hydratase
MCLDLSTVVPCVSGPKRPHDRVTVADLKNDFAACMAAPMGFKGFAVPEEERKKEVPFNFEGKDYTSKLNGTSFFLSSSGTANPLKPMGAAMQAAKSFLRSATVTRSWGRLGPETQGTTVLRSRHILSPEP